jgi:IS1 family transposase
VQLDEIWNFVYAKQANLDVAQAAPDDAGDVWTWTAICADTKLLATFMVGARDTDTAIAFVDDLKERLANRVQLTTDGHGPYLKAVDAVFGDDVDYEMLVKIYGRDRETERRYSPAKCLGARRGAIVSIAAPHWRITSDLHGATPQSDKTAKNTAKCLMPLCCRFWATLLYKSITSGLGGRHFIAHPVACYPRGRHLLT